jgi:hypothetical protein
MAVDAWIQHPTERFLRHDMFASLRRWTGEAIPSGQIPLQHTIDALDAGGVDVAIVSAWHGPPGPMISNDEVAAFVAAHPGRLAGAAAVDLADPVAAVGAFPRTTGATTRCTSRASSSASRSARRSGTPDPCAARRRGGRSPTSTTSRSTSPIS